MINTTDVSEGAVDGTIPINDQPEKTSLAQFVSAKLKALEHLNHVELRAEWRRNYRVEPPKRIARGLLMLGIGWKIQEQAYGGLRGATRQALVDLATTLERDGDVKRARVARLKPGSKLIREWHGKSHTVIVGEDGFEWRGKHWPSLSVIARTITGMHCSGPRFFGVNSGRNKGGAEPHRKAKSKVVSHA